MSNMASKFSWTLDAGNYSDPDIHKLEQDKIFRQSYVYAIHSSQIDKINSYRSISIGNSEILIIRGADDRIRAFHNVCVHRGHLLVDRDAQGCKQHLICPYHAWKYGSDGTLLHAEGVNIDALPADHRGLREVPLLNVSGFLFVRTGGEGDRAEAESIGSVIEQLKQVVPNLDRLKVARSFTQEVRANWKIMLENYLECYHCRPTHPALVDLMDMNTFKIMLGDGWSSSYADVRRLNNKAYACDENRMDQRGFSGWWIWPNMTLNVFPGEQNLLIFHIRPTGPETCVGICDFLFLDGSITEQAEALMDWEVNILETEDNGLVEAAHRGMKSGAIHRGLLVEHEDGAFTERAVAHFLDAVSSAINKVHPV